MHLKMSSAEVVCCKYLPSITDELSIEANRVDPDEELIEEEKDPKNWKSIFIALFVIITVLGLVITAIFLVGPEKQDERFGDKLTLEEFLDDKYKSLTVEPIWLTDWDAFIYKNRFEELILFNCTSNETSVFLGNSTFRELNTDKFKLSADRLYVLFQYDIRHVNTHSRFSTLFRVKIYSIQTKLSFDFIGPSGGDIQYATWSPVENTVIFVQENNIYFKRLDNDTIFYVTNSGLKETIYNGVPDWLYGERVLQSDNTIWMSPNGAHMVYAEIDDTHVTQYQSTFYGDPKRQYSTITTQRYPKAGTRNPHLKLNLFDMKKNVSQTLQAPLELKNRDHYVTMVRWLTTESMLVTWLNRPQNFSVITICSVITVKCKSNFRYESHNGWIDMQQKDVISTNSKEYLIILPQGNGPAGSYNQIASIDPMASHSDGRRLFLTYGKSEVVKMVGYDKTSNSLYYLAISEKDTRKRHLYSIVATRDSSTFHHPKCLTCDITDCDYFDATFSISGEYYILECLGPRVPYYAVYQTPNNYIISLEENTELQQLISSKLLPMTDYFNIPVLYSDEVLRAKMLLPHTLDKEEEIQGEEPGSHLTTARFKYGWESVLCSSYDIIIAYIDTRGSGGRGAKWRQSIYKNIGKLEADDIISTTEYFKSLTFIGDITAVFGVGFGGYVSLAVLERDSSIFNCGLSISPITDWRYIDSFYAERYMGSPDSKEHIEHYNDANISKHTKHLRGSSIMLMHGTNNRINHFQHTAQLLKSLAHSGIPHSSEIYPDADDLLQDPALKYHVYVSMEKFILQCFGLTANGDKIVNEDEEEE